MIEIIPLVLIGTNMPTPTKQLPNVFVVGQLRSVSGQTPYAVAMSLIGLDVVIASRHKV